MRTAFRGGRHRRICALPSLGALGLSLSVVSPGLAQAGATVLDVPFLGQREALCGGAALAMAMRYWGDDVDPEYFAPLITSDGRGIRTVDLERETLRLGWQAFAFRGERELLAENLGRGRPLITLIEVGADRYHYVTVVGLLDGTVIFHDPAIAPFRRMPGDAFVSAWGRAGHWTMLILPGDVALAAPPAPSSAWPPETGLSAARGDADPPPRPGARSDESSVPRPGARGAAANGAGPCGPALARAAALARAGELGAAWDLLVDVERSCPGEAAPLREQAAVALRLGRASEAAALAERAVRRAPDDALGLEILAASRYMAGDDVGALAVWNRLEPVIVSGVELGAPTRSRPPIVLGQTGLARGDRLRPETLRLARRRLETIPSASGARLGYEPPGPEGARVSVNVREPGMRGSLARMAAQGAVGAVTRETVELGLASPLGLGEHWAAEWSWEPRRRRVSVALDVPVRFPWPGALALSGLRSRETYRLDLPAGGTGPSVEENRARAAASYTTWLAPWLRVRPGIAWDRWTDSEALGAVALHLRGMLADDRLAVDVGGEAWRSGGGDGFGRADVGLHWRSSPEPEGFVWFSRLGASIASRSAPRHVWPGAGTGAGRPVPARAHRLVKNGRFAGPLLGRKLLHGGLEAVWWAGDVGPLRLGASGFLDLAAVDQRAAGAPPAAFHADGGLGLRVALPGGNTLRLDVGRGLRDGATAVSTGVVVWPRGS